MLYKVAYSSDANKLLSLPESGMGYQIIEGTTYESNYNNRRFIVYNCELVIDLDNSFDINRKNLLREGFSVVLGSAQKWNIRTESISLVPKDQIVESRYLSESKKSITKRKSGGKSAKDSPKEYANGKDIFIRLSAFENDKRIDFINKKLLSGAYTTTQVDYLNCISSHDNPVDRYALPSEDKIEWSFFIKPLILDLLQKGIVQPAFGHDGGGEEVYFENGSSSGTLLDKRHYGQ
jgi:hypothetical protein